MKRLLLSSTTLVAASAMPALAEVSISGGAEIGIIGGSAVSGSDFQFLTSIDDITFTLSGATDNGLTFGGSIDLSDAANGVAFDNTEQGGETIFVSGDFGTVSAGDVDGAMESRAVYLAQVFALADDNTVHAGFNFNNGMHGEFDGQKFKYDYTVGGFTASASAEIDDDDLSNQENIYTVAASYARTVGGQNLYGAVAIQSGEDGGNERDIYSVSGSVRFNEGALSGLFLGTNYTELDGFDHRGNGNADDSHWGVNAAYDIGDLSVGANYGSFDLVSGGDDSGYGLAASYDLGGGAAVVGGYGRSEPESGDETDSYSFGMRFSF